MLFSGSPSYFRSHHVLVQAGSARYDLPANYDPLTGYAAPLASDQYAGLANGASARVQSTWGFDTYESSVTITDGLGHAIPETSFDTTKDTITATIDALSLLPSLPTVTSAVVYLPKGVLVLRETGFKYIDSATLAQTGIVFGNGAPSRRGSTRR
ncbi:MAG: hypothetical protein JO322_10410 [Candidatus Eremiobacteraeota bacterium]|nr:hypothetical protein [Candidatus Eremiobacteraeota bacterium]